MSSPTIRDWFIQLKLNQEQIQSLCNSSQEFTRDGLHLEADAEFSEVAALVRVNTEIMERISSLYEAG